MNKKLTILRSFLGLTLTIFLSSNVFSQPFIPVPIGGFNQDVVAEAGNSSLTTTTVSLDGFTISNKVIYTNTFKTLNAFGGGGIPDNGIITDASGTYQLADYAANNALLVQRNQTGDILITTAAQFDHIRILAFSTEGASLLNVNLFFSDGTSTAALTNYSLGDWFNNTANLVLSGIGRCTRATPATGADAFPGNPRMYYIDIPIACADRQKNLERINLANVTTAGTNAPYPNAVFFAVSATSYSLNITDNITDATCTVNGGATLGLTGSAAPYNISWNTVPVQNGLTVSNLSQGTYTATITDINGCISTHDVTIAQTNNLTLTADNNSSICFNGSFNANTTGNATAFSWSPTTGVSDPTIANPILSPADTTLYTVTGTLGSCSTSASFTINVKPEITLTAPPATTICSGNSFTANTTSNASSFSWSPTTGVSNPAIASPVFSPAILTTYTVTATTGTCSVNGSFTITVAPPVTVNAGANVSIAAGQTIQLQASGDAGVYSWSPAAGLSATNILFPVASPTVTTTYTLTITSAQGCTGSNDVEVQVVPECAKPMNAITPNGDGINDKWLVTYGNCTGAANVKVYNRYGSPVFEAENYQNNWEGTYKGKPLPDATYYFVIDYKLSNGRNIIVRGDLTILR
ncbi:MAG: gliding motility-associated C-terminal domain-containing protein [Ferruginibacter sp.]|nr:gliding motility-associated C-terminal domain-containing protein [Ferruginibacter sp.]